MNLFGKNVLRRFFLNYSIAAVTVVAAFMGRLAIEKLLGPGLPTYITFYPAVTVTATLAGLGPGVLATFLSSLLVVYWILPPVGSFHVERLVDAVSLTVFLLMGLALSLLAEGYRRNRRRMAAYDKELALRQNEEQFRTLANAIPQLCWIANADGWIFWYNERWYTYTGTTPEQMEGWGWQSVHDPEVLPAVLERWRASIVAGEPFEMVFPLRGADGEFRPFLTRVLPLKDTSGNVVRWFGTNTDVTELRNAQEALRASEERWATTLASIGDAVLATDLQGRLTYLNPVAAALTGWPPREAQGQPIESVFKIVDELTREPAENIVARVLRERQVIGLANHTALLARHGREIPIEDSAAPIKDAGGNVVGAVLVFHDVTEKRRAQEQLERANRTLKALSNSNQALLHATEEASLLNRVCKILAEDCGYAMVWIGYAEEDEGKTVWPVTYSGLDKDYLETLRLTWADSKRGQGPTGTAIRTGKPCRCRNMQTDPRFEPWRDSALRCGYASSLALPLVEGHKSFGAVTLYSKEEDGFSDEEVTLLEELATDLAHGVSMIRVRAARDRAEEALRQNREWLRVTLNSIGDAVLATDTMGRITFLNPVAAALTGWPEEEAQGQPSRDVFRIIHEHTHAPAEDIVGRVLKERRVIGLANHTALVAKDGRTTPIEDSAAPILDGNRNPIGAVLVFHDVTEKRRKEEQLHALNRTLKAIVNSNQAMLHASTEEALLQQVCRIITEDCGHAMMWIGFAEEDLEKSIQFVACAGIDDSYLEAGKISWADTARGHGPSGTSIRFGQTCLCRNLLTVPDFEPWRDAARERGLTSCLALPLKADAKTFGVMVIYSAMEDAFTEDEVKLLEELTADLSFGVATLRARIAGERAAKALRENEQRVRLILSSMYTSTLLVTDEGRIEYANPAFCRLFGLPDAPADLVGMNSGDMLDQVRNVHVNPEAALARIREILQRDQPVSGEELSMQGGRTCLRDFVPLKVEGKSYGRLWLHADITVRKQAEQALRESEERLRMQMERMPIGCIVWDEQNRFSQLNPAAERIFGYSTAELLGQYVDRIVPEADRPFVDGLLQRLKEGKMTADSVNDNLTKDGRIITCQWTNTPLRDAAGRFIGLLSMVQDVTERKRAEEALLRSEKLASVGRMAASIAHEINNPLAAVMNTLFLVEASLDQRDMARQYLEIANDELKRISHITRQTLGFYRESSAPTAVSVSSILDSAIDLLQGKIKVKNATVTTEYDGNLQVSAVPGELRQVFSNLLANSLDAIDAGGAIKLRISRSTVSDGRPSVRITMADNGKGMEAATLPRIFEPLFTTKEATGSGLGLWVSKQLVDKHHGSIRFRTRTHGSQRGTTFSLVLPENGRQDS